MTTDGSTGRFYDDLVDYYDLIYEDWNASMARQGDALARVIRDQLPPSGAASPRVLDVAAGIGTQSLPLAERGFRVTARDLSPKAIARLAHEAVARALVIDTGVADMRAVGSSVANQFEAVICCDNSLPHLQSDDDIVVALSQFRASLVIGGVCICSVRNYETIYRGAPAVHEYGERRRGDRVFRLRQEWAWLDDAHYDVTLVVDERTPAGPVERVRTVSRYYAIGIPKLLELMASAGFISCRRIDAAFYQPILIGLRPADAALPP